MAEMYRADHVGSLLRPEPLKEARSALNSGNLPADEMRRLEDSAILEALEQQKRIGLEVFTDGEFRRSGFQNDMQDSVLVSSKEAALEDQDELLRRIDEAAKFFPIENMALSP